MPVHWDPLMGQPPSHGLSLLALLQGGNIINACSKDRWLLVGMSPWPAAVSAQPATSASSLLHLPGLHVWTSLSSCLAIQDLAELVNHGRHCRAICKVHMSLQQNVAGSLYEAGEVPLGLDVQSTFSLLILHDSRDLVCLCPFSAFFPLPASPREPFDTLSMG